MTRLPSDNWDVQAIEGPAYKVGPGCAVPGCDRFADHAHHLWRRSFFGGGRDTAWVQLWNGKKVANKVGLCWRHHEQVTQNVARIFYDEAMERFLWSDNSVNVGPLDDGPRLSAEQATEWGWQLDLNGSETPHEQVVASAQAEAEVCPTCGHKRRRRAKKAAPPGPARRKTRWQIQVPQDLEEDGHEIVTNLVEECVYKLGREEGEEYHALVEALYYFTTTYEPERDG